jgi:hypothetical protein
MPQIRQNFGARYLHALREVMKIKIARDDELKW